MRAPHKALCVGLAGWLVALAAGACAIPDPSATFSGTCPDQAQFSSVSPFMEVGCGTIDCHGALSRPLRVYGYDGLRLSPTDVAGGNPTTPAEVEANWESVCGLQPNQMTLVVSGQAGPDTLLLLQKPLLQTNHKGGAVLTSGDDGHVCLSTWLAGAVDAAACGRAVTAQEH